MSDKKCVDFGRNFRPLRHHFNNRKKMKSKLVLLTVVAAAVGCFLCRSQQQERTWDDLMQENVEALAWGEDVPSIDCMGLGSVDCPVTRMKVYMVLQNYGLE